jgi:hypothetical protein
MLEPVMPGTIPLNDAVSASGLDPGAAPDWRSVAPSSGRRSFATPQFSCARNERDWFFYLAYSAGERPGTVLRRLAEAYASGAPVPFIPDLGEPKSQRRLIRRPDRVLCSFMLEIELSRRAYARAHADGLSLSAIMRRFVVDYVRRERAAGASDAASVQPKPNGISKLVPEMTAKDRRFMFEARDSYLKNGKLSPEQKDKWKSVFARYPKDSLRDLFG